MSGDVESVWDYPRPPIVVPTDERVVIELAGTTVADTRRALRVLETSHPPVYYLPLADVRPGVLSPANVPPSWCEFKGRATYSDVAVGGRVEQAAAWGYPMPSAGFEVLRDHVAFYPGRMDRCLVDDVVVQPQPGHFYGGWITPRVVGPFKGGPGTLAW